MKLPSRSGRRKEITAGTVRLGIGGLRNGKRLKADLLAYPTGVLQRGASGPAYGAPRGSA